MKVTKTAKGNYQISGIMPHEFDAIATGLPAAKQRYVDAGLSTAAIDALIDACKAENIEVTVKGKKGAK